MAHIARAAAVPHALLFLAGVMNLWWIAIIAASCSLRKLATRVVFRQDRRNSARCMGLRLLLG